MSLLEIKNLRVRFENFMPVKSATMHIEAGELVALIGSSGSGKSTLAMSILKLQEDAKVHGRVMFDGKNIAYFSEKKMQSIRGKKIAMIFQEPMTSLNPVFQIGSQIDEVIAIHNPYMSKKEVKSRSIEMLEMVGIGNKEGVYHMYPHELSGGMRQRIMIAMALACDPKLIVADEPTTALDVTIQAQILDLLQSLKEKMNRSIMLITHDLGVVAEMADYVVVMYAGKVVEKGTVHEIFKNPKHPYTIGLMKSKPVVGKKVDKLYSIPGNVPNPINMPDYCYFKERCEMCFEKCAKSYPGMYQISSTHFVSCYRAEEEGGIHE